MSNANKLSTNTLSLQALQRRLSYTFTDLTLLTQALTHRSFDALHNYERLEFLGDALLGMIIAEALYQNYTEYDEGRLTRMRSTLVRESTLALVATDLDLSSHLILGVGERKGGGRRRPSILADSVEAIIGAIYLDSGDMMTVKRCVLAWFASQLSSVADTKVLKDAKSRLQEWLQGRGLALPAYELLKVVGNAPDQQFTVQCQITLENTSDQSLQHPPITQGIGSSRRIAEQIAAEQMLEWLTTVA